ncbi:MAG TPA: FMN-binding negative transcriptional regulator [Gemmatimonadaceae bacterium]|nr:FMN-binding negative transcriptional regulator [Gemmatimonadaceae bacterium]
MYIPRLNAETDEDTLFAFLAAHPFGALITSTGNGELAATHLPWLVHRERGVLEGHIARANTEHQSAGANDRSSEALVIFTGPDAYISPGWYPSKAEHGEVVPTWNYVAVHVYGRVHFTSDREYLARHLTELVRRHEADRPTPWMISDAPGDYIERQMKAIVGVQLAISRIEGKWKMSQNRPAADVDAVIDHLRQSSVAKDRMVGDIVAMRKPST